MPRFAAYVLLFVCAAFSLDLSVYLFLGHSLGYCPAEGDCGGWVAARMTLAALSGVIGGILLTYSE